MATFISNGTPITSPSPQYDIPLVCNNGALKILDKSQWTIFTNPTSVPGQGVFISSAGKWTTIDDSSAGVAIPLTIGKQYTLVIHKKTIGLGTTLRFGQSPQATPTAAGVQLTDWYRGGIADGQMISFVAKLPYLVMQLARAFIEAGGVDEAIEVLEAQGGDGEVLKLTPSNDTAGVANLLKIDNYVDTQEILTGLINHQLGIYVFDGTEEWVCSANTYIHQNSCDAWTNLYSKGLYATGSSNAKGFCSHLKLENTNVWLLDAPNVFTFHASGAALNYRQCHFNFAHSVIGTSSSSTRDEVVAAVKSYLAAQYAAGTPVIIVYPLATAQDEVAPVPQTMQTVAGDNQLDIVQAGMSGLEVEVKYTTGVAVSITEVENAQLDDNITVTIA